MTAASRLAGSGEETDVVPDRKLYFLRRGYAVVALLCLVVSAGLALLLPLAWGKIDPDELRSLSVVEALLVGFSALSLWLLFLARRPALKRDGSILTWPRGSPMDLREASVHWDLLPRGGRIHVADRNRQQQIVLDNFDHGDRFELIQVVLQNVPGATGAPGWKSFEKKYMRNG